MIFINNSKTDPQVDISTDYPIALEVDELVMESDGIVKGRYTEYLESWNMARNPIDIQKPADDIYIEGKIFIFEVDEYIKGNGDNKIRVNLKHKIGQIIDERYMEPTLNEELVIFLSKDEVFNNYYGVMQPFEFRVLNESMDVKTNLVKGNLEVKTNLKNIESIFKQNKINTLDVVNKVKKLQ